jgi:hypothetical protein
MMGDLLPKMVGSLTVDPVVWGWSFQKLNQGSPGTRPRRKEPGLPAPLIRWPADLRGVQ